MMFNGALCHALIQTSGCGKKTLRQVPLPLKNEFTERLLTIFNLHSFTVQFSSSLHSPDFPTSLSLMALCRNLKLNSLLQDRPENRETMKIERSQNADSSPLSLSCFLHLSPFVGLVSIWMDTTPFERIWESRIPIKNNSCFMERQIIRQPLMAVLQDCHVTLRNLSKIWRHAIAVLMLYIRKCVQVCHWST